MDKIDDHLNAGIYGINCENCEARYLGQTKIKTKFTSKDHFVHLKYEREGSSPKPNIAFTLAIQLTKTKLNY